MNERIKELEKQCWGYRVEGVLVDGQLHFDTEKFAELIVRECIAQLEIGKKCDPYTGELFICERNDDIDYEIDVLKEHFGVE